MCGIVAVVGNIDLNVAERCIESIAHRGPDGAGIWRGNGVTLGHRRLAILDVTSSGRQPMCYGDGRYWITFNGEIYNFVELREELRRTGYRFVTDSDTEVVLAAFARWGSECLAKFNGMWAFAIWDEKTRQLFLARDRLGKKPLFYVTLADGGFAFASEMKALFPLLKQITPNVSLIRDAGRIFTYEATDECVIENIRRFPAGHYGWLGGGKLTTTRYWCTLDNLVDVPTNYEEQIEVMRDLFVDACRIRMRSDVRVGTALSGGVDSTATICAMAYAAKYGSTARMGVDWQHAFVASMPGTPIDETDQARKVTDFLELDLVPVLIDPGKVADKLDEYLFLTEEPYITSPIPFMLTYGTIKAYGVSVTIDGHGADELFGGYPTDFAFRLKDVGANLGASREIARAYMDSGLTEASGLIAELRFVFDWHARYYVRNVLRPGWKPTSRDSTHPAWDHLDELSRILYVSTHETVLPTLLRNYDRYSMANGVEIRMPFLDHRIVSFAFSLDGSAKCRNSFSKAIVRDAIAPFAPEDIVYRRRKIGFNSPIVQWMQGPMREYFLDTIESASFKECNLVDTEKVKRLVSAVVNNLDADFAAGERAWTAIVPFLWERAVIGRMRTH